MAVGWENAYTSIPGEIDMPAKKKTVKRTFETIPVGTKVTWHYRSAIGHGTVTGVHKLGTNADNTMYSVRETDHHPGEPAIVHHSGKALSRV
ncbi:MAG TPA: hypothetical protein VLD17_15475 [Gemmatimonadaceae bacterium]|nr:hypothetical protein [Gemmatimonadaceae bacterium]